MHSIVYSYAQKVLKLYTLILLLSNNNFDISNKIEVLKLIFNKNFKINKHL